MSTEFYTIIEIEIVLLAFSAIGLFTMPLKLGSKTSAVLLKIGFLFLLISVWLVSLFWSNIYKYFSYYLIVMLVVHLLFLILSVLAVFSITKNIKKRWIKYLSRFMGISFILCLEIIMTMVLLIGY